FKGQDFEILSVSVDIQGAEVAKPYAADKSFTTAVDSENVLANYFGFKVVPNGIFIDKKGFIRLIKQGFKVSKKGHVEAVEKLSHGTVDQVVLDDEYYTPLNKPLEIEKQLSVTKFKLGMEYAK